ncbi:ATP-binding cassette domain-containing protein [Dokdonella sp.]|uniref:ATP-binding cassette domain-containing protein n=1 Tax=Dokdonella sp. TaxID=2291710 RepID=UPI001B26126F|nr:ATP-binding cassette domain-containing protein [Dokdonella sp.]MBO9664864.1 ATP-binding cassette domain-containing protein [Dokdonella sp.]
MSLVNLVNVDYSVGGPLLLEKVDLAIEPRERVCIVGRNGAGKSTLLKLIAGDLRPDDGEVRVQGGARIARLTQEVPHELEGTVFDVVAAALGELGALLAEFHRLTHHLDESGGANLAQIAAVQARIDAGQGWNLDQRVTRVLERLELAEDADFPALSGGMKRRVLLARALVIEPDLLLLDEPTNHLDIEAIAWLEQLLLDFAGSVVFVTHDRRFLRALATRIVEIDRGQVTSWPGDYENYLRRREERLHAEAQANALFDKKLAQEEVWIRQGIKARRTRNEGRVRALEAMRRDRAQRRELGGRAKLAAEVAVPSGRRVVDVDDVRFGYGERRIVDGLTTTIQRGDRIGLIGANGSGKTTLLKLLLGELAPQSGEVRLGTNLEIAYFDQHRSHLREDASALDNVAEGREYIEVGGARKHALGYLQDFLFSPERARAPITMLSGGERNRLLLAKLFAKPSNLLVMDEPTNDLDVETLELLEELLANYQGTLLLVSHDREFLDNVVTGTLALEGGGRVGEYVGGYTDWLRQRPSRAEFTRSSGEGRSPPTVREESAAKVPEAAPRRDDEPKSRRKLSYKETRELEELPQRIEGLETRIAELGAAMQEPAFYAQDSAAIVAANDQLSALQAELDAAYARWQALEAG